ncbi:MAG: xanthine dehydrogenase family protein molybdopterin-binding subunit [Chloroflexota bacterium]
MTATATPIEALAEPEYRVEGRLKVTGQARYAADVRQPGMLHAVYVRSPFAHARIRSIDVSEAREAPGVHAVLTGADLPEHARFGRRIQDWPVLARDVVRFIGDRVVAIAAETRQQAESAAQLVHIEYDELPTILSVEDALRDDAPVLHPHADQYAYFGKRAAVAHPNVQGRLTTDIGSADAREAAFANAHRVFEHTFRTPRQHQGYIEPHACAAWIDSDGRVRIHSTNKTPFALRQQISRTIGVPEDQIIVSSAFIGGDFGGKGTSFDEYTCYFLARASGRPVKAEMRYVDELGAGNPRHSAVMHLRTAVDCDGHFLAHETRITFDGGAYAAGKPLDGLVVRGGFATLSPYRVPQVHMELTSVYTNNVPGGHMRAPGEVQALFAGESHVDLIARGLGMDPIELRLRNAVRDGETNAAGEKVRESRVGDVLAVARRELGWDAPRADAIGRGVAVDIRHVGGGKTSLRMRLVPDAGQIEVLTGMVDQGAGAHTVIRRVASAALSIAPERIVVRYGDTGEAPQDPGSGGSRVTHVLGQAALDGGTRMKETLEELAAEAYGWPGGGVQLVGDRFVAGDESASFEEVVDRLGRGAPVTAMGIYDDAAAHGDAHDEGGDFNASVYAVEIVVDRDTGAVRIVDAIQVVDVGTVINPTAHQGQLNGGFAFGVGAALMEELPVDEGGRVAALSLGEYKLPCQMDMPPLRTVLLRTDIGPGPFGAKAVGEVTNSGVAPAIGNAIEDAVGVRIFELPLTSERVLAALAAHT